MTPKSHLLLALSVLTVATASLSAATVEELTEQLQKALDQASKAVASGENAPTRNREVLAYLPQIKTQIAQARERGDLDALRQTLAQVQVFLNDEETARLGQALVSQLQADLVASEKAQVREMDEAISKAVALCFAASDPKELDDAIIRLSNAGQRERSGSSFETSRRSAEKARAMVNFLCRWQDYLAQTKAGNTEAATSVLKSLSQDSASYPFVPRSEILKRMPAGKSGEIEPQTVPSLKGKTLADIESLKKEVREQLSRTPNASGLRQFLDALLSLDRAVEQLNAGLVGQAFSYCTNNFSGGNAEEFQSMRQALLLETLPVYLDIAKTYPVAAQDTPAGYLKRVLADARAKGDWMVVWKTLEAYRSVAYSGQAPTWLSADITGTSQFIVAQNLEKAGQWADAIRTYRRILGLAGENLPLKEATERLVTLKKEHPEAFDEATKAAEPATVRPIPGAPNFPR